MSLRLHHTSNFTKMVIIVELFVVSYLLYTLTVSIYKSYQIDQHIISFKNENDKIAQENKQKEEDYSYYSSDAYIEKIAKQNLGLINPGEQVIVITPNASQNGLIGSQDDTSDDSSDRSIKPLTNPQKWWKFFFDIHT